MLHRINSLHSESKMGMWCERLTIPQESEEKLSYNADRLVASAVTRTSEYMIGNGLEQTATNLGHYGML